MMNNTATTYVCCGGVFLLCGDSFRKNEPNGFTNRRYCDIISMLHYTHYNGCSIFCFHEVYAIVKSVHSDLSDLRDGVCKYKCIATLCQSLYVFRAWLCNGVMHF